MRQWALRAWCGFHSRSQSVTLNLPGLSQLALVVGRVDERENRDRTHEPEHHHQGRDAGATDDAGRGGKAQRDHIRGSTEQAKPASARAVALVDQVEDAGEDEDNPAIEEPEGRFISWLQSVRR